VLAACSGAPEPAPASVPAEPAPVAVTATASASAPVARPAPQLLAADTPFTLPSGTRFTAPRGWTALVEGALATLTPPETDSHFALFDAGNKPLDEAVAAAWEAYRPGFKRVIKVKTERPGRFGWEEVRVYSYETSPNERATIYAVARRKGDSVTVFLSDATDMTYERRNGALGLIVDTLMPRGFQPETFAGKTAQKLDPARIKLLTDFVQSAQKTLGVPGAALALLDGNKIIFTGGFGVKELGKPAPVDADTRFAIASNTKGMVTLLLATMVDEGKLSWETPVTQLDPSFKLGDAETTAKVRVKHLICACTGLPRQDMEWIFEYGKATPESSLQLLGTMQPTSPFGEAFQYSNLMAAAAGYVAGHVLAPKKRPGEAFDQAMKQRIFAPLGLKSATFDLREVERGNHASPHANDYDGKPALEKMDLNYSVIPVRPAGGAWMSVKDLARYAELELNKGVLPGGKRLVSESALLARRAPQVPLGKDATYGMGLEVDTTWGVPVVHHGGSLFGYKSDWMILPESGVGAVLLTNSDRGGIMLRPLMRRLLEVVFDGKPEAEADVVARARVADQSRAAERARVTIPPDPTAVSRLADHYHAPGLGDLTVRKDKDSLDFDFGETRMRMATRKNEDGSLSFVTIEVGFFGEDFTVGEKAGKRTLTVRDGQHEYVFVEQ
jgi:CubicO group peptidase (beta-lactamase class C family)